MLLMKQNNLVKETVDMILVLLQDGIKVLSMGHIYLRNSLSLLNDNIGVTS